MDMSDLNSSLQEMIDISSSESEDKVECLPPPKKAKLATKKRPRKYKKSEDRLNKVPTKRYGKTYGASKSKSYSNINGMVPDECNVKVFSELNDSIHLLPVIEVLEKYNFKYEIQPDVNKQYDDFFLQDKFMSTFFKHYPDYICIDLLCEIIELELNLYLFISVDSNGHCEIVAIGLFKSCEAGLIWFCDVFKKHNPNWHKIKLIVTDKNARNNENVKSIFPEKLILISFFHSLKALKKDLSNLDCKLSEDEFNKVLQIFEQMIFATDETAYADSLKQIKSMPSVISTYFRKSWNQKKDSWVLSQHINSKVFLKSFNSYLNSIRKTIRPLISTLDSVDEVIKILCNCVERMREERFKKFTDVFPLLHSDKHSVLYKYSKILTSRAVELISEQIDCSEEVKNLKKLSCGKYVYSEDIITINTCSCNFFQLFSLPCSHIFSVRRFISLPFYAESLCSFCWFSTNYQNTFIELQTVFSLEVQRFSAENPINPIRFQKYFQKSAELWPLLVASQEHASQDRLLDFRNILRAWEHGIKVTIKSCDVQKETSVNEVVPKEVPLDNWKDVYGISLKDILDSDNDIFPLTL